MGKFVEILNTDSQNICICQQLFFCALFYATVSPVLRALANEETLLRTHCCRHKCFPAVCPRATFVADTNFVSGTQKMFLILFRNILYPQQMFPSLHSPRNIMGNNVSATMCPRLPGPLCQGTKSAFSYTQCSRSVYI